MIALLRDDEEQMMEIREYRQDDLAEMVDIWNEVVRDGVAFPQEEELDPAGGSAFFASQTYCGVAEEDGHVIGLYILHPNNVGRCGHIANASYAVGSAARGKGAAACSSRIRWPRARRMAFVCCNSTPSSRPTRAHDISTRSSASCNSAPYRAAFACPMARMPTSARTITSCRAGEAAITRGGPGA